MVSRRLVRCPRPSATDDPSLGPSSRVSPPAGSQDGCRPRQYAREWLHALVPHTTALAQAEPVTVHAAAGPTRTTGESSLLRIFSISLEPSFSHGPTLANGRHIGFGGIHWDFSALFPQRYHTSAACLKLFHGAGLPVTTPGAGSTSIRRVRFPVM